MLPVLACFPFPIFVITASKVSTRDRTGISPEVRGDRILCRHAIIRTLLVDNFQVRRARRTEQARKFSTEM